MSSVDRLDIQEFGASDGRMLSFESVRTRSYGSAADDPVSPVARRLLALQGGEPVARLSFECGACRTGEMLGVIGHYEAANAAPGVALLRGAVRRLEEMGAERVVGPMNGSTWARYRLVLPVGPGEPDPPPFLGEPRNPPDYPAHWEAAGFSVGALYESRVVEELEWKRPRAGDLAARIEREGLRVRSIDLDRLDRELELLHAFSERAFADNPFYRPLAYAEFRSLYAGMVPLLDRDFVLIAHTRRDEPAGFLLAYPDTAGEAPGAAGRLVLKTLAAAPWARRTGLAAHLADRLHETARVKGYRQVIHALMHVENDSLKLSYRFRSGLFRRYALYSLDV